MSVIPEFDSGGRLPAGIHSASWKEIAARFGFTTRRKELLRGLLEGLALLGAAGCRLIYLDGSFVTSKPEPGDFDVCWGIDGVDIEGLDPVFLDFANGRGHQKQRFLGEFFPAEIPEGLSGMRFLEFFQTDKETGEPKGIIEIDLGRWQP